VAVARYRRRVSFLQRSHNAIEGLQHSQQDERREEAMQRRLFQLTLLALVTAMALGSLAGAAPLGSVAEFSAGLNAGAVLSAVAAGPDGNVWFTDHGTTPGFGRIAPSGAITMVAGNGANPGSTPRALVLGPDGNLWFGDFGTTKAIGRFNPTTDAITEFSSGLNTGSLPNRPVVGPDGNIWFSDQGTTTAIGRITPSGVITEFSSLTPTVASLSGNTLTLSSAATASGAVTLTFFTSIPQVVVTTGSTTVTVPSGGFPRVAVGMAVTSVYIPAGTTVGSISGNTLTLSNAAIAGSSTARLTFSTSVASATTTSGSTAVTVASGGFPLVAAGLFVSGTGIPVGAMNPGSVPGTLVAGADGNVWFTDAGLTPAIGRITPGGTITEFSSGLNAGALLVGGGLAAGPDGNIWFTDHGATPAIGRITPGGTITEFSSGLRAGGVPYEMAAGADGNIWFTDTPPGGSIEIGQITTGGAITEYAVTLNAGFQLNNLTTGPDGNLWSSDGGTTKAIARFGVGAPAASVTAPAVAGLGGEGIPQACGGDVWSSWAGQKPSHTAYGYDGYQWLLDGSPIAGATGPSYTPTVANIGHLLSCKATVTYTLFPVTESATSAAVSVFGPIVAQPTALSGVEGAAVSGAVATFTVADTAATAANFSAAITWGDGSSSAGIVTGSGGSFTVTGSHSYADEGSYAVGVALVDLRNSNNKASVASSAGILDAPLSAGVIKASCGPGPCVVTFGFSDANPGATAADFAATIDWADGSSSAGVVSMSGGGFVVSGSHAYSDGGSGHAITVKVSDDGGSTVSATAPTALVSLLVGLKSHHDDQGNGSRFRVEFSCSSGTPTALLNGVAVTNGQVVRLKLKKSGSQKVKTDDRKLTISATSFLLVVSCSDAAGNQGCATATAVFEHHSHDDSQKDAENEQDSGQHGGDGGR
jgi:streptogramin lyase